MAHTIKVKTGTQEMLLMLETSKVTEITRQKITSKQPVQLKDQQIICKIKNNKHNSHKFLQSCKYFFDSRFC